MSKETKGPVNEAIEDDLEIIGIFKAFLQRKEKLWVWQKSPDGKSQRVVHYALVKKIDSIKKMIELRPNNTNGFLFADPKLPLYVYSNKRCVALKSQMRECTKEFISIPLPKRLNGISGEQLQNLELIEKENEQQFQHQRQSPRLLAKEDQVLALKRKTENSTTPIQHYKLYDMSQGGLAFEVYDPTEFIKDEELIFVSLAGKMFQKEIHGRVVSVRQMSDDTFKVGVEFT